jgi:ABC-2 type transport system permease protein
MSAAADTAPDAVAPASDRFPWMRLYAWSVRRELWENRFIYLAPLAIGAVGLFGALLGVIGLHRRMAALSAAAANPRAVNTAVAHGAAGLGPYSFAAAVILVTGLLVSFFYCVGALYGERRDRSILFWKSLPVSDTVSVLAKATLPMVVVPLVTLAVAYVAQAITLAASTLTVVALGYDPALYWAHANLTTMWVMLPYGLFVVALWHAPVVGWLLMVSAWAKRTPILWAIAPPVAPAVVESLALGTHHGWDFIGDRLTGGGIVWTQHLDGKHPVSRLDQVDFVRVFTWPDIWVGLVFAALFLAAAIWLRRRREPV